MDTTARLTHLLEDWSRGDQTALDQLFPLVYDELRRLARHFMREERTGHTLQTTALVHEAYLRLVHGDSAGIDTRAHFFAVAAQVMRHILVDHARGVQRVKRGQGMQKISLEEAAPLSDDRLEGIVAVDEALTRLAALDSRKSRVFEMRFFSGMSMNQMAGVLKVSPVTIMRDWRMAKAWLAREIGWC
jgi:RNA polymerase sigma factor (TIGR02999 family)